MPGGDAPMLDQPPAGVSSLLHDLTGAARRAAVGGQMAYEDQLAEVRLGIASSLFMALRCKHAPTAAHSLRVALGCSSWSLALELNEEECSQLEVAALLHDIGKISVPDAVLLKPGTLGADELLVMDRHRQASLTILRGCCSAQPILEIVRHLPAWYNGSRPDYPILGRQIPLGARMLSIVDAFDSMTTDQVYRAAMSRDRALSELFSYAGTQFDPDLVELFSELHQSDQLNHRVAARWLEGLKPADSIGLWRGMPNTDVSAGFAPEALFQQKLLDNMHDAVMFVDRNGKILMWNRGAERLTGISAGAVCEQRWQPGLIGLRDEKGSALNENNCPIASAMQTSVQSVNRFTIRGRNQRPVAVDLHAVPILSQDGVTHGAAVLMHDASPEASLEKRCQSLHERATKDPLTQVANRAEFDHTHKMFVAAHLERQLPCSLIICDIDRFKQINDTYGHQAGDEALKIFAQMLKSACRPGDLVARYGGEEFVILCADCNTATAAQRAEQMRKSISILPQSVLDGHSITASFGVTEVQTGDTTDTMLRRADRALLEAKQRGRNMVVQLGSGADEETERPAKLSWFKRRTPPNLILEKWMVSAVPLKMAIEKIRGFVADYHAEIIAIEGEKIVLQIDSGRAGLQKRGTDRPVPFTVELRLTEEITENTARDSQGIGRVSRTKVYVAIRPRRERDRRRQNVTESAKQVAASIKSYLMANEEDAMAENANFKSNVIANSSIRRATNVLIPWMRNP
jgi:diguanylate cyclase (GGDEF)-like protein/PAS domain S-box-containing protein